MMDKKLLNRFVWFVLLAPLIASADVEKELQAKVYSEGGSTLYCQGSFSATSRLKFDYIYDEKSIVKHFGCITARQCASKPGFSKVAEDMHNIYPIERKMDLKRRGTKFGLTPASAKIEDCGYSMSFQTFNPPEHARGNVARAMVYMHKTHKLPLMGTIQMYKSWSEEDPPDDEEKRRNGEIFKAQGARNPYIDNPDLMNGL